MKQELLLRSSTVCELHPDVLVTGFCASCLRKKLVGVESDIYHKHSITTTSGITVFKSLLGGRRENRFRNNETSSSSSNLFPELRKCKSFSYSKGDASAGVFEPQRKSCDVRVRNTLWSLFYLDDESCTNEEVGDLGIQEVGTSASRMLDHKTRRDEEQDGNIASGFVAENIHEITEEIDEEIESEIKPMREHIELEAVNELENAEKMTPATRDLKEIVGNFWSAASVFSKKLQKWRRQKTKRGRGTNASEKREEKPISRPFLDTQLDFTYDGFGIGRRSCDTDSRFSLDAGRVSFDDPRYSWDEPRASWDDYLVGRPINRLQSSMCSVIEDAPVERTDNRIPVEDPMELMMISDVSEKIQTRKLERSVSVHKVSVSDEFKIDSNTRDPFPVVERESKDSNSNSTSLMDDSSESFDSTYRDLKTIDRKGINKSHRWRKAWNLWGFIYKRRNKESNVEGYSKGSEVYSSFSWTQPRKDVKGEREVVCGKKITHGNSNPGSRNSRSDRGLRKTQSFKTGVTSNGLDNGLLRFYLTPLRTSRKGHKKGIKRSNSFSRNTLGRY